jgi:hypothetical protein
MLSKLIEMLFGTEEKPPKQKEKLPNKQEPEVKNLEKNFDEKYANKTDLEMCEELWNKSDDELSFEEEFYKLGLTLNNERQTMQERAIQELMNGNYQILSNEHQNPYKELINFTLIIFINWNPSKKHFVITEIALRFPIMYRYILREVFLKNPLFVNNDPIQIEDTEINKIEAFEEFIHFIEYYFGENPDKESRDVSIKQWFKILYSDVIYTVEGYLRARNNS